MSPGTLYEGGRGKEPGNPIHPEGRFSSGSDAGQTEGVM